MVERVWHRHWPKGLPVSLDYPEVPVGAILKGSVEQFGTKTALVYGTVSYTFHELYRNALRFSSALRKNGIGKGDVVAVHLFNTPQYMIAYYGILLSGAVFCPVSPLLPPDDIAFQLRDCDAAMVITHERLADVIRQVLSQTSVRRVLVTGDGELTSPFRPVDSEALGPGWSSFARTMSQGDPDPPAVAIRPVSGTWMKTDTCLSSIGSKT
ncbi:MAG: AMP-binding protein, partial [Alicyclobacillaceae bacterium]|nr:AMP-binding protein [Alicyclobacillaceae bacterium]